MDAAHSPTAFQKLTDGIRRAYTEFLLLPSLITLGFLLLAIGMYLLDRYSGWWIEDTSNAINKVIFRTPSATRAILAAIAGSLITITSITFTVLLVAIQQSASAMTTQVLDQFLRRRLNQAFLGYFVGVSLYTLAILTTIGEMFNPVLSATFVLLLTAVAVYLLAALVYITLTQVRASIIVGGTHDGTLEARRRQLAFLKQMRTAPTIQTTHRTPVRARSDGYLTRIDLGSIHRVLEELHDDVEVILKVEFGAYIAYNDTVAEIATLGSLSDQERERLVPAVLGTLKLGRTRDLDYDPRQGIEEIANIGWTTFSTAKHSPVAGFHAVDMLRDLLARWTAEDQKVEPAGPPVPFVYEDSTMGYLLEAMEILAVAATESSQVHSYATVLDAFSAMFDRLPADLQDITADIIPRIMTSLPQHQFTTQLDRSLDTLIDVLRQAWYEQVARSVEDAREQKMKTIS